MTPGALRVAGDGQFSGPAGWRERSSRPITTGSSSWSTTPVGKDGTMDFSLWSDSFGMNKNWRGTWYIPWASVQSMKTAVKW